MKAFRVLGICCLILLLSLSYHLSVEGALIVILPLILTGLGFLTYRHPELARKILYSLFIFIGAIVMLTVIFDLGQEIAYRKSRMVVTENALKFNVNHYIKTDSLKNTNCAEVIYNHHKTVRDSILNHITTSKDADSETPGGIIIGCGIAYAALVVLLLLSYQFDELWKNRGNQSPE